MAEPGGLRLRAAGAPAGDLPRRRSCKVEQRIPAARRYIVEHGLNERFDGEHASVGLIVQGGLHNALVRALQQLGLADALRRTRRSRCWCSTSPTRWCREQIASSAAGKRAVLVLEEGQPEYIEKDIATALRRPTCRPPLHGKDLLPPGASTPSRCIAARAGGVRSTRQLPRLDAAGRRAPGWPATPQRRADVAKALRAPLPARPPGFCVGCPERPVFSALKLAQADVGPVHVAADIGCHAFAHLRAVLLRPLDPGLRHEPGQPRRRVAA